MQQIGNSLQRVVAPLQLGDKELQAIQMRYLGKPSKEIAQVLGYNESSVRRLFMSGGRLERAYQEYALRQQVGHEDAAKEALERVKEETKAALERIIELSKSAENEAAIFKANEFLLSLAGVSEGIATASSEKQEMHVDTPRLLNLSSEEKLAMLRRLIEE